MPTRTEISQYIIITGNVIDGLIFMGPFRTRMRAHEHAVNHMAHDAEWWIAEMLMPDRKEGRLP